MTSRIGSPDTQADIDVRDCLAQVPPRSFVMVAGAGSGKTTSLIKALAHLGETRGKALRRSPVSPTLKSRLVRYQQTSA